MSDISIRDARLEDAGAITNVLLAIGWFARLKQETPTGAEQFVADLLQKNLADAQSNTVLVAERQETGVLGYCAVHWFPAMIRGIDGYVSELFVHPSASGQGTGGRLLTVLEQRALRRGCTRLLLMNRRDRESYMRGFYAKHGWEEVEMGAFFIKLLPE